MLTLKSKSFEEYMKFKPIKGQIYRIVSRKHPDYSGVDVPALLDLGKNEWFDPSGGDPLCLCLDERATRTPTGTERATALTFPAPATEWDLWYKSYYKVLYQEKPCLIHVSWLEKIV